MSTDIPSRVCFPYYLTRDVKLDLKVRICRAEGLVPRALTVSAVITSARRALHQTSKDTSLPVSVFPYVSWDEWLVFPVRYSDLAPDAEIEFTFRDQGFRPAYRASLALFKRDKNVLKVGAQRIRIWTPSQYEQRQLQSALSCGEDGFPAVDEDGYSENEAFRIAKIAETLPPEGDPFQLRWLERLLHERVEAEKKDQLEIDATKSLRAHAGDADEDEEYAPWLIVELPLFRFPIIASEKPYAPKAYAKRMLGQNAYNPQVPLEWVAHVDPDTGKTFYQTVREEKQTWRYPEAPQEAVVNPHDSKKQVYSPPQDMSAGWEPNLSHYIEDPESERDNPSLQKTLKLSRSGNANSQGRKPNKEQAAKIELILKSPILKNALHPKEAALLWEFRHVLCSRGNALVKFLYAVDKSDAHDISQALELLGRWADIEVADALILLSKDFTHDPATKNALNVAVRRFAVKTLRKSASDADLRLYLLQLVQALRHEPDLKALQQSQQPASGGGVDDESLHSEDLSRPSNSRSNTVVANTAQLLSTRGNHQAVEAAAANERHDPTTTTTNNNNHDGSSSSSSSNSSHKGGDDDSREKNGDGEAGDFSLSPLADLLLERCVNNRELSNFFHWFVEVESHAPGVGDLYAAVQEGFLGKLETVAPDVYNEMSREQELVMKFVALGTEIQTSGGNASNREKRMRAMLGRGGSYGDLQQLDESIPLPHAPHVRVQGLIAEKTLVFKSALCPFVLTFIIDEVPAAVNEAREIQRKLMDDQANTNDGDGQDGLETPNHAPLSKGASVDVARTDGSLHELGGYGSANGNGNGNANANGNGNGNGYGNGNGNGNGNGHDDDADKVQEEPEPATMKVMMKIGDDLRQDQLIIQLIQLMDTILKRVNLDLKLTPYAVLAVSRSNGLLEFLSDSPTPLSGIKDIRRFLADKHPSKENHLGIRPEILDNFVRSCAGSAVVTWILAVGDRHLDNILLKADTGKLVHIDFGYIFGKEPKQNVPNIRVTKAMVEAMGGVNSKYYNSFKNLAGQAFNILRRHANLILALLKLMADADLEAVSADDFTVVQDRFMLGYSDEMAERHLISEIEFSVNHKWMAVLDALHDVATSWR